MGHHVLTQSTPLGRKLGPKLESGAAPLIRVKLKDLASAGVEQVARTAGMQDGLPVLEDGVVLDASNVIWCTGFRYDFGWIDLPVLGEHGAPLHRRGIVEGEPGLYFMGLVFQYAVSSDVLPGMSRDAAYIARHIAALASNGRPAIDQA
jgi:putative flavoprotein involved in K+ transport